MISENKIGPLDNIILYISPTESHLLKPHTEFRNTITHSELISRDYNTYYKGFYILKPNPLHLIRHTPRQTQILFEADISLILYFLNLKANMKVLESGTGSGTLTKFISEKIGDGILYSYERNIERFGVLETELESYKNVDLVNGDVNSAMYEDESLDAIFLDVPEPWTFIEKGCGFLKKGKRLCVFVPTIEQVLKVRDVMSMRFEMRMFENIKRRFTSLKKDGNVFVCKEPQYSHTGFLVFGTKYM